MPATAKTPEKTIEVSDLFERRSQTLSIPFTDDPDDFFTVTYLPDRLNKTLRAEIRDAEGEDAAAVMLHGWLSRWSLTSGGKPHPITVENLQALGLPLLMKIADTVQDHFNANFELGKGRSTASPPDSATT